MEGSQQVSFVYSATARQVLYVNAAYEKLFAPHRREQVNSDLPALLGRIHPDDVEYSADCFERLVRGQLKEDIQLRLLPLPEHDKVQWLGIKAHQYLASDGQVLVCGTLNDISAEREYLLNADKFNAKKNTTLEILSHDLAGPFNLLQQMIDFCREKVGPLQDPQVEKMLQVMHDTCRDSVNLIRDFVDQEFMESTSVQLKRERFDLARRLRQIMDTLRDGQAHLGKHFEFICTRESVYAELDDNKFLQVVNNLLSNAIKFTPDNGHIRLSLEQRTDTLLITIADDGIGIPQKFHDVLFDRFTPARRPGLRGEKTTGLGMSLIHTIVKLHEGRIWFESEENQGTTFFIEVPASKPRRHPWGER
ncbi:hypothetical protein GCM10023185_13590 [Hymenobacter saemangeumensis]|uniref:histidine kinase n=1 Tax=Hymenobacter saemangeumensis TaxID=1084522 RepID=A0ABP8I821_9BACT